MDRGTLRSVCLLGLLAGLCVTFVSGCGTRTTRSSEEVQSARSLGEGWVRDGFDQAGDGSYDVFADTPDVSGRSVPEGFHGGGGLEDDEDESDELDDLLEDLDEEDDEGFDLDEGDAEDLGADTDGAADDESFDDLNDDLGAAEEPVRPAPRPAPRARRSSGEILRELGLHREAREEQSRELLRQAGAHLDNHDLLKAEAAIEEALMYDPTNVEAQRKRSSIRLLLGEGDIGAQIDEIKSIQKVAQEQAEVEIRRLVSDSQRLEEEGQYVQAISNYEKVLQLIRSFPNDLNLDRMKGEVTVGLERLRVEQQKQEEREREQIRMIVDKQRQADRREISRNVTNKLRELRRKAEAAEEAQDYDRAITLYEQMLSLNSRDDLAALRLKEAEERRHIKRMDDIRRRTAENYELAIVGIEESSVIYQQIFRYPDVEEWLRLAQKDVSLGEQIAAAESPVEREIKRKLAAEVSVDFQADTPFRDVLRVLREISGGVNFSLTREAAEFEDETIQLAEFSSLPLVNLLGLILDAIGAKADTKFGYVIKEGAVVIGPTESLKIQEYLQFYDISDLISVRPNFAAPTLALDELAGRADGDGSIVDVGLDDEPTGNLGSDQLLTLIRTELSDSGEDEDEVSGISLLAGKLSARTTFDKHLKLIRLLEQFRKSTGVMITVESRFLDIQDNFLETIGVDIGNEGSNFLPNTIPDIDGNGTSVSPGYEYVNPQRDYNSRVASIGQLSTPIGSQVNPFNMTPEGGGAYQLNVLQAEEYQLEAILTGVAKEQEIRRLNSPRVTAFNGQTSHTLVVSQSAFIQDLEVNQTGVIPVINPVIGVLNSGSILEVRPTLSYDRKYVVLEVQPTLAEQLESDVAVLNLSGNFTVVPVELPVLSVTKIKTTVTVPDGGTVLVGGLKREITTRTQIGIPGLLDIPVINLLFGRRGLSTMRSNLFVLLNAAVTVVHEEEARLFGA